MSEDKLDNVNDNTPDHSEEVYKELALKIGWDPKGEKPAKEFVEFALEKFPKRGAALKKQNMQLESKDNELNHMKIVLDQLASDMNKQKQLAYNQALADIKAQRVQAIEAGRVDLVEQLDNQQAQLAEAAKPVENANQAPDPRRQAAIEGYLTRNADWLDGDDEDLELLEMRGYAELIDKALGAKQLPIEQHIAKLEAAVMKKFPNYFNSENEMVSSVESGEQNNNVMSKKTSKKFTYNDLNEQQKSAAKFMADNNYCTMEVYIQRLVDQGDLK